VTDNPADLTAGFAHRSKGTSSYRGALRRESGLVSWTCKHDHLQPFTAKLCAEGELERRKQGIGVVFELLHCEPCADWWEDARGVSGCPRCGVPLERVKVAVVSRESAS